MHGMQIKITIRLFISCLAVAISPGLTSYTVVNIWLAFGGSDS